MKLLILVDRFNVGIFSFSTYIFEHKNESIGYGIFLGEFKNPMIMFENFEDNIIRVSIKETQVQFISDHSHADKEQRQEHYKEFMQFVHSSEKIAAAKVFRGKKMEYLAKSKFLAAMRKIYYEGRE
ncbi:hypothetical protein [Sphingobacterium sp. SYP-B4668]|uniref:hypothetical protein n=1 Tax=Sphingobacterium sp. SYP-B4668 TaxID=2996035 RepID=UPI0022DE811A|nr:hypothetical protein [Sphingobacterium sp. SYP-B4668]